MKKKTSNPIEKKKKQANPIKDEKLKDKKYLHQFLPLRDQMFLHKLLTIPNLKKITI